jgi:hypothetical protein
MFWLSGLARPCGRVCICLMGMAAGAALLVLILLAIIQTCIHSHIDEALSADVVGLTVLWAIGFGGPLGSVLGGLATQGWMFRELP